MYMKYIKDIYFEILLRRNISVSWNWNAIKLSNNITKVFIPQASIQVFLIIMQKGEHVIFIDLTYVNHKKTHW